MEFISTVSIKDVAIAQLVHQGAQVSSQQLPIFQRPKALLRVQRTFQKVVFEPKVYGVFFVSY